MILGSFLSHTAVHVVAVSIQFLRYCKFDGLFNAAQTEPLVGCGVGGVVGGGVVGFDVGGVGCCVGCAVVGWFVGSDVGTLEGWFVGVDVIG